MWKETSFSRAVSSACVSCLKLKRFSDADQKILASMVTETFNALNGCVARPGVTQLVEGSLLFRQ